MDGSAPANDLPAAVAEGDPQDQDHRKELMQTAEHSNGQALPGASQGDQGRE